MSDTSGDSVSTGSIASVGTGSTHRALPVSIMHQSGVTDGGPRLGLGQGQEGLGSVTEGEREVEGRIVSVSTAGGIEREGEESKEGEGLMQVRERGGDSGVGNQETEQSSSSPVASAGTGIADPSSSGMSVLTEARTAAVLQRTPSGSVVGSSVSTTPMMDDGTVTVTETETETDTGVRVEAATLGEGEGEAVRLQQDEMSVPSGNTALYSIDMATAASTVTATVADSESVAVRLAAIHVATLSTEDLYSTADETDEAYLSSLNYSFVSFISFPFVLSSSSKAAVLECDATQQMRRGEQHI